MGKKFALGMSLLFSSFTYAENTSTPNVFAALAIDRSDGFAYGFSHDYSSLSKAEDKALSECSVRSKNCSVVLSWSGDGCGVYRTVDGNIGTAYGWGITKSRAEADIIATREAQKRSAGKSVSNIVWACNSDVKHKLNVIKNLGSAEKESQTNVKTVTIGNQTWMTENLSTTQFQNGENISLAKSIPEYVDFAQTNVNLPLSIKVNKEYYYNWYAASDTRNICPKNFRVPTERDWDILMSTVSTDQKEFSKKMRSKTGWNNGSSTDSYGLNIKPTGYMDSSVIKMGGKVFGIGSVGRFWSSSLSETDSSFGKNFAFIFDKVARSTSFNKGHVTSIRCIKN